MKNNFTVVKKVKCEAEDVEEVIAADKPALLENKISTKDHTTAIWTEKRIKKDFKNSNPSQYKDLLYNKKRKVL